MPFGARPVLAGMVGAVAILVSAAPVLAMPLPAVPYVPVRYHCVAYGGHGYHRCSGGYGSNDDPNWGGYRSPSDTSGCPRPHSHTGDPYGQRCDGRREPGNAGGRSPEPPHGS